MNTLPNLSGRQRASGINAILEHCQIRHYPADCELIRQGDCASHIRFVLDGSLNAFRSAHLGGRIPLHQVGKDGAIGCAEYFLGLDVALYSYKTREFCKLAELSYFKLGTILSRRPDRYGLLMLGTLGQQVARNLVASLEQLARVDARKSDDSLFLAMNALALPEHP